MNYDKDLDSSAISPTKSKPYWRGFFQIKQTPIVEDQSSDELAIIAGEPQGSRLGPLYLSYTLMIWLTILTLNALFMLMIQLL